MQRLGIAGRVFLYTASIVCAVLLAALAIASRSGRRTAVEQERRTLEQAVDLTAQLLAGRGRSLAGGTRVFVQNPYFRAVVAKRSADDVLDQAFEAADQLGANWVFITDENGVLLAKSDEPGVRDVPMADIPLVAGALAGRTTSGFGVSRDSLLFQAVAVPIVVPGAAPVGVLVATRLVDDTTARDVHAATASDVIFYALDASGRPALAATSLAVRREATAALPSAVVLGEAPAPGARAPVRRVRLGDAPYALHGAALTTAGGEIVGGFLVARPEGAASSAIVGVRRSLLGAGVLGLVLALLAAWSAARLVTRPARTLAAAAARARDGDYEGAARSAAAATTGAPRDEIAALGHALTALMEELREKQALVAMLGGAGAFARGTSGPLPSAVDPAPERATLSLARHRARLSSVPAAVPEMSPSPRLAGALEAGAVVADRFAIIGQLGAGGSGIVYRATDLTLNEVVAIKMLRPEIVSEDALAREALKQELRLARRVSHRNVVRTHDFGMSRGVPFITMEYVDGASLAALIAQRGPLPREVVMALGRQLARALEAAHEQGVVHGDLKPANVLVSTDGLLKVTDFGISVLTRLRRSSEPGASVEPPQLAGAVVGTPEYMAPEQLLGEPPGVRTDLYAAGVVLHECLSGESPFPRDTPREFLARKLDAPRPHHSSRPSKLDSLEAVLEWMTAPEAADRPDSAAAISRALARLATFDS